MRRSSAIAGTNILVQVIHVSWDKSGRGGIAARRRSEIPLALPLPDDLSPDIGRHLLVHKSLWGHTNAFATAFHGRVSCVKAEDGFKFGCATVRGVATGAELDWTWDDRGGIPPRRSWWNVDGKVTRKFVVGENEWVRARWNARFTCDDTGTWWYEAVTINVGVCPETSIPRDFFTRSEPVIDYSQLAYLR